MSTEPGSNIERYFGGLSDPRTGQNVQHKLLDIISIAICGILCGADNWVDIEMFGQAKQAWLSSFLELKHGIPWHDTFGRVFRALNAAEFEASFAEWTQAICELSAGTILSVDGKQMRCSKDGLLGQDGIYMVSVWAGENNLVLAQDKVADHTNEITAIPKLLKLLDIRDSIVTIDGIGCQTDIVNTILAQGADYVIAVKANQGTLFEDVQAAFGPTTREFAPAYHKTIEKGHGRIEIRECWACQLPDVLDFIADYKVWPGLRSLVKIQAERRLPNQVERDTRFFIASLDGDPKRLLDIIRSHWQIENQVHWVLDIAFRQDENRARKDNAPNNLAVLQHIALNLLKQEQSLKVGVKAKRLRAGWDQAYLLKVLCAS
jgi:predicted transposase YbfD/YdcC